MTIQGSSGASCKRKEEALEGKGIRAGLLEEVTPEQSVAEKGISGSGIASQQGRAPDSPLFPVEGLMGKLVLTLVCIQEGHVSVLHALAGRGEMSGGMEWGDSVLLEGRQEGTSPPCTQATQNLHSRYPPSK